MTQGEWIAVLITAAVMGVGVFVAYWMGHSNGVSETEDRLHRLYRGSRGFERPAPRTAVGESRVLDADFRNKAEGFDA